MDFLNQNIILYLVAYILSGIPFGYLLAKFFAGVDIKNEGSGNIGATNVIRVVKAKDPKLAKKLGIITFILDAFKGVAVILVAMYLNAPEGVLWTIAVLAVIGHCFSIFLSFEGGKGIATGFGVLLVMMPIPALIGISLWFVATKVIPISVISAMAGLFSVVIASYIIYPEVPVIGSHAPIWIIAIIVTYKHIPNIVKMFKKEEPKAIV